MIGAEAVVFGVLCFLVYVFAVLGCAALVVACVVVARLGENRTR